MLGLGRQGGCMGQQQSSSGIMAGAITILGLGLVWVTVAANFPSQEEFMSDESPAETRLVTDRSSSPSGPPSLDLTIPTSPPLSSDPTMASQSHGESRDPMVDNSVVTRLDPSALQASRLKCDAEIQQLCPDDAARARCLEQRAKRLPAPCQNQLNELLVRWKDDRNRLVAACDGDIRRFCRAAKTGRGEILQCLQSHGQAVSDQCYQILPKGTVFFK